MANYLELCQATLRESDTGPTASLVSIEDANQYNALLAKAVQEAWRDIQASNETWGWRQKNFTLELVSGTPRYEWNRMRQSSGGEVSIRRFHNWIIPNEYGEGIQWLISSPSNDHASTVDLPRISWQTMRSRRFALRTENRPTAYAVYPDLSVRFHPTPDDTYRIYGMYQLGLQILRVDGDIPEGIPDAYHDVIKWRAVMNLHSFDKDADAYQFARMNYRTIMQSLENIFLPDMTVGRSLA